MNHYPGNHQADGTVIHIESGFALSLTGVRLLSAASAAAAGGGGDDVSSLSKCGFFPLE